MSPVAITEIAAQGVSLTAPAGTELVSELPLLLWLPELDGQRPWLMITPAADAVPVLEDWVADELRRQDRTLDVPLLLAMDPAELFGLPAIRTLVHHADAGRAATLAQWWAVQDGIGVMVAASCATPLYHLVAPLVDEILRGVRFDDDA